MTRGTDGRPRFLVTGATGFLGAHATRALLSRGFPVTALVRDGKGDAAERLGRALRLCGADGDAGRVPAVAGDLAQERFGLPEEGWRSLAGRVDAVVHCAASTAFAEVRRDELFRVNVRGTENALALAVRAGARAFHLVSSAYAAGGEGGTPSFTNPYEETKHLAEEAARREASRCGFSLSIYRPTIVYGDSRTGRSLRFNALYYPVKTVLFLRDLYLGDLRRGGGKARALGVRELPGGGLYLPLRVETDPGATLNMVPVDHFSDAFLALLEGERRGGTFPIVTDERLQVETVLGYIRRLYGIEGLEAAPAEAFRLRPRSALESLFEAYTALYRPYMRDRRTFDGAPSRPALEAAGVRCPRFTYEVFERIMRYAEEVDWGKRL